MLIIVLHSVTDMYCVGTQPFIFGRDKDGVLVLIKRATGQEMMAVVNKKLFALGMFPWLVSNNLLDRGKTAPAESKRSSVALTVANKRSSVVASSIMRGSVITSVGGGDDKSAGKANLLALFSKKGSVAGTPEAAATKGGPTGGPNWAKDIPMPPPVPGCWPPVPYTGKSGGSGDNSQGPSGANSPLPEGLGGSGSDNPSYDPSKPKLKQVYLVGLPSIAGTLWEASDVQVDVRDH